MLRFNDPLLMPGTGETPEQRIASAALLMGTPGQDYAEKRGIPVAVAHEAGVRFDADWNGRAAVTVPLRDHLGTLCSVHGRYLQQFGKQNKMFTIGREGGVINIAVNGASNPIIIVEGLLDALSLAVCGYSSFATIGRWASWLPGFCIDKEIWIAFDATRPGEADAALYKNRLTGAQIRRLLPPGRCKDWNTALLKFGRTGVSRWLRNSLHLPAKATML